MYTLPNAVRLKDHLLERWEAAERDPSLVEDGALNVVIVGGRPDRSRDGRRGRRALPRGLREGLPDASAGEARVTLVEAGPGALLHVQAEDPRVHGQGSHRSHGRGQDRGDGRIGLPDPRDAEVRRGAEGAHPGLGRRPAGEPARADARARAAARQSHRRRTRSDAARPPRGLCARRHRGDHGREDPAGPSPARLRRPPVRGARRRVDRSPHRRQGDEAVQVQGQGDDGGDRSRCRSRADARRTDDDREGKHRSHGPRFIWPSCRRTRTARRRSSTGRGPAFTHQRAGRITVEDE